MPSALAQLGDGASLANALGLFLDGRNVATDERRLLDILNRFVLEQFEGAQLEELSLAGAVDESFLVYPGEDVIPIGGYSQLISAMAEGVDVRLGEVVTDVSCTARGVEVHASERHRGSHVLVTLPLGVLKAGSVRFTPGLPERKHQAIETLGYGNLDKVVMTFAEPFWHERGVKHAIYLNEPMELPAWFDFTESYGVPTFAVFVAGPAAREMSRRSDGEIRSQALAIAGEMFGRPVPTPTDFRITRWETNPLSLGSYSFLAVGSRADDFDALAEPVFGRVLFAGEATSRTRWGTADGAMASGSREAERVLRAAGA